MTLIKPNLHFRIRGCNRKVGLADAFHDPGLFTWPLVKSITMGRVAEPEEVLWRRLAGRPRLGLEVNCGK